jgi:hypothetical protein
MADEESWKDAVRIREEFRKDTKGNDIERGTICWLGVNGALRLVVVHGCKTEEPIIHIDLNLRKDLGIRKGETYEFTLKKATWWGRWRWAMTASDPAYRIPAQISVISLALGVIALFLGIIPLVHHDPPTPQSSGSSAAQAPAPRSPK